MQQIAKKKKNEYKTKHDWVGKIIHTELCKKLKFDLQVNEMQKNWCGVRYKWIQIIPSGPQESWPSGNCILPSGLLHFTVPANHRIKKSKMTDKCLNFVGELKKKMEHEDDSDSNCNWCTWNSPNRFGGIINQRKNRDYPDYRIVEIYQNTRKSKIIIIF